MFRHNDSMTPPDDDGPDLVLGLTVLFASILIVSVVASYAGYGVLVARLLDL